MNHEISRSDSKDLVRHEEKSPKSGKVAFTLACLTGFLGLHRFYTGRIWTGLAMLFTFGGFFMWWVIDVMILLTGRFKDSKGRVLGPPRRPPRALPEPQREDDIPLDELLDGHLEEEFEKLERDERDS